MEPLQGLGTLGARGARNRKGPFGVGLDQHSLGGDLDQGLQERRQLAPPLGNLGPHDVPELILAIRRYRDFARAPKQQEPQNDPGLERGFSDPVAGSYRDASIARLNVG